MFGLINIKQLFSVLTHYLMIISQEHKRFKNLYKKKEITEWEYYKTYHELQGRYKMIEDFFKKLEEMA